MTLPVVTAGFISALCPEMIRLLTVSSMDLGVYLYPAVFRNKFIWDWNPFMNGYALLYNGIVLHAN